LSTIENDDVKEVFGVPNLIEQRRSGAWYAIFRYGIGGETVMDFPLEQRDIEISWRSMKQLIEPVN
jgi:hypothetical protein